MQTVIDNGSDARARVMRLGGGMLAGAALLIAIFVTLAVGFQEAPIISAIFVVILIAMCGAFVAVLASVMRQHHHDMIELNRSIHTNKLEQLATQYQMSYAPGIPTAAQQQKLLPFIRPRSPSVALQGADGNAVDVSERNLRHFVGMNPPSREEWQGDNNDFAAIASNFLQRGYLVNDGRRYQWADGGRGQARARQSIDSWCQSEVNQTW